MPFLGMLAYLGFDAGVFSLPGISAGLFLLAAALSGVSWWGFRRLHLAMQQAR
jgi:hypothetical protein